MAQTAMAADSDDNKLAVFCDFENVALGVRDARYSRFDMSPVLERLLLKGSIVVKKAYCDWERYKEYKSVMHESSFELIEIPHVRQSGKNSADIRMVVDALDLCYTKSHVDTFVRENAKTVIGVGVKNSSSDLLINNCDEFIFYDDLVKQEEKAKRRRRPRKKEAASQPDTASLKDDDARLEAIELVVETVDALFSERGNEDKLWGSMIKQALKRRRPEFNERACGYRSFNELLEEARERGYFQLEPDERSGGYIVRATSLA
jgi:uncharacterized LabA/DUF88 family protein